MIDWEIFNDLWTHLIFDHFLISSYKQKQTTRTLLITPYIFFSWLSGKFHIIFNLTETTTEHMETSPSYAGVIHGKSLDSEAIKIEVKSSTVLENKQSLTLIKLASNPGLMSSSSCLKSLDNSVENMTRINTAERENYLYIILQLTILSPCTLFNDNLE